MLAPCLSTPPTSVLWSLLLQVQVGALIPQIAVQTRLRTSWVVWEEERVHAGATCALLAASYLPQALCPQHNK